jgi:lipoate-protein ligase A
MKNKCNIAMKSHSTYKVPNGKLLKITLEYNKEKNLINILKITGDFFAYPEESIELIENKLKNSHLKRDELIEKINSIVKNNQIEFIGINAEGLADGILMCLK